MKPISTLIIILCVCINLGAQWKIGPSAAYGFVTQESAQINVVPMENFSAYKMEFVGSTPVQSIGFMAINDLGPVFLQSGLFATTYGLDFMLDGYKSMDRGSHIFREQYYSIEIPFNAGIKVHGFKIGLGPVLDIAVDKDSDLAAVSGYRNTTKALDFGFQAMLGYRLGILNIDLKYLNKFSSITDAFDLGYDELKYKKSANRFMLAIGVAF